MTNENSESHAEQFEEHQKKKKCNLSGSEVFTYIEDEDTKMIKDNRKIQAKKNRAAPKKISDKSNYTINNFTKNAEVIDEIATDSEFEDVFGDVLQKHITDVREFDR